MCTFFLTHPINDTFVDFLMETFRYQRNKLKNNVYFNKQELAFKVFHFIKNGMVWFIHLRFNNDYKLYN